MACRSQASTDAFITHEAQTDTRIGTVERQYRVDSNIGSVVLSLSPSPRMTWADLKAVVIGFTQFMGRFETLEVFFSVKRRGEPKLLALGYLAFLKI